MNPFILSLAVTCSEIGLTTKNCQCLLKNFYALIVFSSCFVSLHCCNGLLGYLKFIEVNPFSSGMSQVVLLLMGFYL